jgi:hypothetical protein
MRSFTRSAIVLAMVFMIQAASSALTGDRTSDKTWPRAVPCRIQDGANPDLFLMTLGDVETPLAQGTYDPRTDTVTLKDGTIRNNYFRDVLGVKFFKPLDKSIFPLPPSGFCTWYYYYQDVNEDEVKRNARWIAANLKDYGAQYVQIDDGWQGETKNGRHGSRDWTTVDKAFPGGMAALAADIKSLGLTPGIWLAPHGQSNEAVVKNAPGVFLFKPDGTSASETWEGKFLVDPSAPETRNYLEDLFAKLAGWGYEYFKIDGQPIVVEEYGKTKPFMKKAGEPDVLYRSTLNVIREAIGPKRYLLGCWGTPIEGAGIMDGSRTGGDVVLGWDGFGVALQATMEWYFTHNVVWYADPDVMLLRPPLTVDQARVWATLQGLTGQALLSSDRLMDLSEDRVELMRRVFPAVDIRPLDLFPSPRNKRIWDLKIDHLGRSYDVVGVFNFGTGRPEQILLDWKELGLPADRPVHVFDFWNHEYLGAWEAGMAVDVAPASCRVLTLLPDSGRIQLASTSRHITQGWIDLAGLAVGEDGLSFTGKSRVIKNDPYELHFAFPRGKNFAVKKASARSFSGPLPARISNHQGWATVRIDPAATTEADWDVVFEPADSYRYPTREPGGLQVDRVGLDGADFTWDAQYYLNAGYQVYLDGRLLGYTPNTSFPLRRLEPDRTYTAEVRAVWNDGSIGERHKTAELKFSLRSLLPDGVSLTELEPVRGTVRPEGGRPIVIGGKPYAKGISGFSGSEVEFDVKGLYGEFSALAVVNDGSPDDGQLEFIVSGDGRELWRSGPLKKADGPKPVKIGVACVRRLVLRVADADGGGQGEDRFRGLQGDWIEAWIAVHVK